MYPLGVGLKTLTGPPVPTPPPQTPDKNWNVAGKDGKARSYAKATTSNTAQGKGPSPKITGPQKAYGKIPTHRFMQPAPKPPPRCNATPGKCWMIRFH